jgi:hypothetical protein
MNNTSFEDRALDTGRRRNVCAIFIDQKPILRITKRGKRRMTSMMSAQIPGA